MPSHRKRRQFKQTDAFTRGMVIGLKRAGWSIRQIAADTHLGASTMHRLWRRWLEQGNVAIYRNVGATRVTSARVDRRILRQAVAAPQATCTAILQHVQDTLDHSISTRTISRRLVANGLHSCRPLRRLPLTPPNRRQRLEWCRARSTWMTEWHRVVFSDKSRFCLPSDSRRVRVWRRRGERSNPAAIVERPTVRQRGIMIWGAIAYDSRSPLLRIQGTMTAQRYVDDVLRPVTLPYLQGVPNALYQQDNARPHTARISQQALQDVQMLPWPPYSPDLSPIEHVWDIIGRRLHALPQPRSEDELWQMVEREWRAIPQDAIRTLIDSLPRRVAACIAVRERKRIPLSSKDRLEDITTFDFISKQETINFLNANGRIVFCIRGFPGSGKRHLREFMAKKYPDADIFSAKFYPLFSDKEIQNNRKPSHIWCEELLIEALKNGQSPIILVNSFIREFELETYFEILRAYACTIIMMDTSQVLKFGFKDLVQTTSQNLKTFYFRDRLPQWCDYVPWYTGWFLNPADSDELFRYSIKVLDWNGRMSDLNIVGFLIDQDLLLAIVSLTQEQQKLVKNLSEEDEEESTSKSSTSIPKRNVDYNPDSPPCCSMTTLTETMDTNHLPDHVRLEELSVIVLGVTKDATFPYVQSQQEYLGQILGSNTNLQDYLLKDEENAKFDKGCGSPPKEGGFKTLVVRSGIIPTAMSPLSSTVFCLLLAAHALAYYPPYSAYPPRPYKFGYEVDDSYYNRHHHKEESDIYGGKTGSYGYTDAHGIYRHVSYVADGHGFRAYVSTNEPGTSSQDPADVKMYAKPMVYNKPITYYKPDSAYYKPQYYKPQYYKTEPQYYKPEIKY
ncbi:hypothetical protein LAZ67_5001117 [Cordylochernes scorpioides]|uniref:Uncharacterized protein n=1 Tax=Cordylochernes scorpioides TaxID=51811 RepID=A0ABY6KFB6_9ARAC|nr:hypothetical protein LAZ67_5001117 [Cordylochernes scorpioides]